MILTTTPTIQNKNITEYLGIVSGETVLGTNIVNDFMAMLSDLKGERSSEYEKSLLEARENAKEEIIKKANDLGADAIVGVDIDYEEISGDKLSMLMVSISGTAVKLD